MINVFHVDAPTEQQLVQKHGFALSGWVHADLVPLVAEIRVTAGSAHLGSTQLFFPRADVADQLHFSPQARTAFLVDCSIPEILRGQETLTVTIEAIETSGEHSLLSTRTLRLSAWDYRGSGHGYQLGDGFTSVIGRASVYASGPPSPEADPQCVNLLTRYLEPAANVIDVGCGIGAYGRVFRALNRPWVGCEIRPDFVEVARADALDARLAAADGLPFEDGSFDAAIAIEVLEHVRDPDAFVREIHRIAPNEAYFSVPNFEAIPVTSAFYALPWHMLEPDHWNFFSRSSLKAALGKYYESVEAFEYGPLPLMRSIDGLTVYNHIFAVARGGR